MLPRTTRRITCVLVQGVLKACHQQLPPTLRPSSPDSVNVGYGQQGREQVGHAVQSITADDIATIHVRRVEELLAGRFPGVMVLATPGGGWIVRVRNSGPDRPPLYVVDGVPVEVRADRGVDWLNPEEIERIDILRDPAETSMFGGRGANGVVVIRTKKRR